MRYSSADVTYGTACPAGLATPWATGMTGIRDRATTIPMPPREFQALVCGPDFIHLFHDAAQWVMAALEHERMCAAGMDLLDVGCGCGRVARYLLAEPIASYTGFDRHGGMIAYCRAAIPDPRFIFDHFDLESTYASGDGVVGAIPVESFAFPYPAGAFDHALLASVFTHMLPAEAAHYLGELGRVIRPGGKVLLSVCFSETQQLETRDDGLNVFYEPERFESDLRASAFDARAAGYTYTPGEPFRADQPHQREYGYAQNWYVLTRR
ncbi:MAG: class I SAM-dependent methyltransferase [Vicinamibacterales bacterium]